MAQNENRVQGDCKNFEQDLVLYYYGECDRKDRLRVESHLEGCASCRRFLDELRRLLPLTSKLDEPDAAFWDAYSREIHGKLAEVRERPSWWNKLLTLFHPWPVPALATALILVVALTLTFTKGMWRSQGTPPAELTLLEILPVAENLEFFEAMEILDTMDLLEAVEGPKNGSA
ncbi:MAG: zf-HC2 domain-containing protein [Deltaproteobacteria bacterium]|nr:zf-HC2 domain-containing protein [Deltaproteobacteria bacterium]MCZ6450760.1 zf-HC2 domain-containing protein [Deltaproteobacteria bacterium]MCZ6547949.1 zf-HC2 domain-containing protein [Deltaproteobacteria bacterium]MCZ6563537.1 zf-HC2 domain-containing protein [Deltaproteobacteria bacterium]MCZ6906154.1 zf-HC2 domain-containing protein [Deltaproteobacteria bacterium]